MWRTYLDLYHGSDLYPLPWFTWETKAAVGGAAVLEITTANDWAAFVAAYSRADAGMIYPDWVRVASDFAGIHMTLRAVAATQGFVFETGCGLTAPAFWDIESTLWLRWCFESVRLVDITR